MSVVGLGIKVVWTEEELAKAQALVQRPVTWFGSRDEAAGRCLRVSGLTGLLAAADPAVTAGLLGQDGRWRPALDPHAFGVGAPDLAGLVARSAATITLARGELDPMNTDEQLRGTDESAGVGVSGTGHVGQGDCAARRANGQDGDARPSPQGSGLSDDQWIIGQSALARSVRQDFLVLQEGAQPLFGLLGPCGAVGGSPAASGVGAQLDLSGWLLAIGGIAPAGCRDLRWRPGCCLAASGRHAGPALVVRPSDLDVLVSHRDAEVEVGSGQRQDGECGSEDGLEQDESAERGGAE